jgi:hypothetical protein
MTNTDTSQIAALQQRIIILSETLKERERDCGSLQAQIRREQERSAKLQKLVEQQARDIEELKACNLVTTLTSILILQSESPPCRTWICRQPRLRHACGFRAAAVGLSTLHLAAWMGYSPSRAIVHNDS